MFPISHLRLSAQQVENPRARTPQELVAHMGALQAQDFAMSKWAIGCRIPGSTEADVEAALNKGEILRTHVLRPTWHLVAAADIRWMLELTAPHIKASMKSRNKALGISPEIFKKSRTCLEKALADGAHLSREELVREFQSHHLATDDNRASHLLAEAELDGVLCSGTVKGNAQTYALLPLRVPNSKTLLRDEALAELANRYFMSHGPATLADFAWWSGLPVKDARQALEAVKSRLVHETVDEKTFWWNPDLSAPKKSGVHLLPAFDEFIISYKDRGAALTAEHHSRAVSANGIFRPVWVADGQVRGLWKRTFKKNKVELTLEPFGAAVSDKTLAKAAARLGLFLGKEIGF